MTTARRPRAGAIVPRAVAALAVAARAVAARAVATLAVAALAVAPAAIASAVVASAVVASVCAVTVPVAWASPDQDPSPARAGGARGHGRIMFPMPPAARFNMVQEGDRLLVVFRGAGIVRRPPALPRNVLSIDTGLNTATLRLAPGAQTRLERLPNTLVIDVLDPLPRAEAQPDEAEAAPPGPSEPLLAAAAPPRKPPAPPQRAPAPAPALAAVAPPQNASLAAAEASSPVPSPAQPAAAAAPAAPAPTAPAPTAPAPTAPAPTVAVSEAPALASAEPPPAGSAPPQPPTARREPFQSVLLRVDADVGVAAFRRGDSGLVVLDRRVIAPPAPEGTSWLPGAVSMTLQVPLAPDSALKVERAPGGWSVARVPAAPPAPASLAPAPASEGAILPMPRPGRVVTMLDPLTGGTLLVGTSLDADADAALATLRRTPDYVLLPSWLGVAVEPAADRVDLRPTAGGFVLTGNVLQALPVATDLSRRFELPDEPPPALLNRLGAQLAGAAAAQPRARTRDRVAAAQTMIALGLGAEAQAVLQLVAAEDPQAAADAEVIGLRAVAALLAGRLREADGLDDHRLDGTDEIALWRGLRDRQLGRDTPAVHRLAALAPLALSYPPSLRRLVWPAAAEAAVEAGAPVPADKLPPFARARLLERSGKVEEALAAFASLEAGPDRLDRVRAGVRLAELRLASGRIGPAAAADALEREAFAWRGDGQEARLRLRAAELRGVAGEWKPALAALRDIETQFPDERAAVRASKTAVLQAMLAAEGAGLSPLDLVLLAADYADGVPDGPQGAALARLLAEKLLALDLPARAIPVLQGLMRAAPAGEPRAEFGARLAQLLLDGKDPAGAMTALDASAAPDLPPKLLQSRDLLLARARAAAGDLPAAAAGLVALGTDAADDLRATLFAAAGDWRGSLSALSDLAAKRVPAAGPLDAAAQDVLLRQAAAASQAPDPAALRALERFAPRMTGERAGLFRVLTAPPLAAASDLPRAARELTLARGLPQQLNAIGR